MFYSEKIKMSKILLCSHNYWAYDPILLLNYLDNNKIFEKKSKVAVITSVKEASFFNNMNLIDINFEFIITSDDSSVSNQIIDKLNKKYNLVIFYPPRKIKSGILRILKSPKLKINLNDFDIFTVNMYVPNTMNIPIPNDNMKNMLLMLKFISINNKAKIKIDQWFFDIENINEEEFIFSLRNRIYPKIL